MCLNSIKEPNVLHLCSTTHSINYDFRFKFFIINKLIGIGNPFSSQKKKKTSITLKHALTNIHTRALGKTKLKLKIHLVSIWE